MDDNIFDQNSTLRPEDAHPEAEPEPIGQPSEEPVTEQAAEQAAETEAAAEQQAEEPAEQQAEESAQESEQASAESAPNTTYTVQNPNPYFSYYQPPQQPTVQPVPIRKKKNPLLVALIVVSILLIVSIVGSMAAIVVFTSRQSGDTEVVDEPSGSSDDADDTPVANKQPDVQQQNKQDGDKMDIEAVADKVIDQVVGIVVNTGSGWYLSESQGSGIIFSTDGYIITNAHVVENANTVKIVLPDEDNTTYDAKIIGSDSKTDLAVLKVDATGLNAADIGNSNELRVGETVVAIGNPYGLEFQSSVTAGIVSALNRSVTIENTKMTLIQTDAAINPGNSGGALVNLYGQVVGINSSKISDTSAEGLGFSIPINDALPIIRELIEKGFVSGRPMIGIQGQDVTEQMSMMYRIPTGVYVSYIDEESSAYRAGLRPYDIITKFNGKDVTSFAELDSAKDECKPGDIVEVEFYRADDRNYHTIKVTLSESTGD